MEGVKRMRTMLMPHDTKVWNIYYDASSSQQVYKNNLSLHS